MAECVTVQGGKRRWHRPAFDPDLYGPSSCKGCGKPTFSEYLVLPLDVGPAESDIWEPLCRECLEKAKQKEGA